MDIDKQKYVNEGGSKCPNCGGTDFDSSRVQVDLGGCWQHVRCEKCNAEWDDVYELTGISNYKEG